MPGSNFVPESSFFRDIWIPKNNTFNKLLVVGKSLFCFSEFAKLTEYRFYRIGGVLHAKDRLRVAKIS